MAIIEFVDRDVSAKGQDSGPVMSDDDSTTPRESSAAWVQKRKKKGRAIGTGLFSFPEINARAILVLKKKKAKITYPETRRVDQVEEQFGIKVADPYRWLENDVRNDPRSPIGSPRRTR